MYRHGNHSRLHCEDSDHLLREEYLLLLYQRRRDQREKREFSCRLEPG